uniref:Hydroxyproline-rich glycoprotein family protein n=1 Tax=Manihot esculenta TaxID=3983 RepID=A0A2C9W7G8_MANES
MEDLYRLCLEALPNIPISDIKGTAIHKKVAYFFKALKSIRDSWSMSHKCLAKYGLDKFSNMNSTNVEQLAAELFDKLEDEELNEDYTQQPGKSTESHPCNKSTSLAAENYARTAVSPDISNSPPRPPPRPPPPGVQVCQKSSILPQSKEEVKAVNTGVIESRLQKSNGTEDVTGETGIPKSAPPPPVMPPRGSKPTATPVKKGFGPPPPPPIGGKSLLQRKAVSKLKRSTQMPSLFQILKEKMEGSNLTIKSSSVRTKQLGGSSGGREGMSATLAELSKRSTYFLQIQEDIQKYAKSIFELKAAINSFQTNDMVKLLKFRNHFESILGVLTDESQVLAKFEDFPTQKLETLRAAAALYSKLETIVATLKNWEIVPPLSKLLDKVECYIRKIKVQVDAFERNKDEESKKFKSHNIEFDFLMFTRVKESVIDLSSGCMELALKERREAKTNGNGKTGATEGKMKDSGRLLWRVFRLAFQAYSFAGGQDDHSTKLANELANEILVNSQ